ncbi:MAG: hypothetical protein U9O87_09225 [Verrucomicrobiota bacterium]|nr:hypothetical protein [Verrucomicrobiota bacterium]
MSKNTTIVSYDPEWGKVGDLINEKLVPFAQTTPYLALVFTIPIIAGVKSAALLIFCASLLSIYFTLLFNKNSVVSIPKMGEINDAIDMLKEPLHEQETVYYFAKFGSVVKEFKGETTKEANNRKTGNLSPNNILYEYLVGKSLYTMGILLAGATGAGKTVSLTSTTIHPIIKTGSGMIFIEGKGDRPISEGIYSMAAEHGREDDVFFLDFAAVTSGGFSHSVAPLASGGPLVLNETLTNLIDIMTGDNSWVSDKATEFMQSLLFILVPLRDLDLIIEPEDMKLIKNLESFENPDTETKDFNLTLLQKYLNFQSAIDLAFAFRELLSDPKFVSKLSAHPKHKSIVNLKDSYLFPLINFLTVHSIDMGDRTKAPVYDEVANADVKKANNYAINPWTKALGTFGNEAIYGSIFNKEYPDINFIDAMKSGKIIIASLPSLQNSRDKNEKIGKMLTALIKSALGEMLSEGEMEGNMVQKEAQKRLRPYKLPFMLIFDEISNYGSEMMGQISSMCRSIGAEKGGIGMMISGQSETDLKRMGDNGIDGDQLKANLGIAYFLNLADTGYAKLAAGYCGKKFEYELKEDIIISKGKDKGENDITRQTERKEVEWYPEDFFQKKLKKQTGEGIIIQNGYPLPEKIVANFIEPKPIKKHNYDSDKEEEEAKGIILTKNISHKKLMKYFTVSNQLMNETDYKNNQNKTIKSLEEEIENEKIA